MTRDETARLTTVEWIETDRLLYDVTNPRLVEAGVTSDSTQRQIVETLWHDFAVDEVALSIARNGFFPHEPLLIEPHEDHFVVIEGNRRLAAVNILLDARLREELRATDLPDTSQERLNRLQKLPCIITTRSEIWEYVGFKHVNGPQPWQSFSKAKYIAWVHNDLDVPLDAVAAQIGDKHSTVQRLYRALMVLEQAAEADVYEVDDRYKKHFSFSHLYTGLDYSAIQDYIGLSADGYENQRPVPQTHMERLGELCVWLWGSKSLNQEPVVQSQNPHLRQLSEVLTNADSTAALRAGLALDLALDVSKGDEAVLRETLAVARSRLQKARGLVVTGYDGQQDLLDTAQDILDLADSIVEDMRDARRRSRRRQRREENED